MNAVRLDDAKPADLIEVGAGAERAFSGCPGSPCSPPT